MHLLKYNNTNASPFEQLKKGIFTFIFLSFLNKIVSLHLKKIFQNEFVFYQDLRFMINNNM